ncbi:MAG: LLM class F420-dependent oxidoreductase [Gaiellaceae bacterium]
MKFGFSIPMGMVEPETIVRTACRGEELGFSYVSVPDHTVIPRQIDSRYPYNESGGFPGGAGPALDQLALMAFLASATTSIRLLTSVLVLPIRNPVVMANQLATVDVLSGGRLTAGCGVGWLREEFEAAGVDLFKERAAVSSEYIQAFRELWTSDDPTFAGEHVRFSNIVAEPKPLQQPTIPIWIGGESPGALRRAGRLADAWYPINVNPRYPLNTLERFLEARDTVRAHAEEAGRDPASVGMTLSGGWDPQSRSGDDGERLAFTGAPEQVARDLQQWETAGVKTLIVRFPTTSPGEVVERLEEFAETVMPLS